MDIVNVAIIFILLILIPASCSIIAMWKDDVGKGIKFSITVSIVIAIFSFLSVAFQTSYELDNVGIISTIASIISIPTAVAVGWNIYSVIDIKSIRQDYKKSKEETTNEIDRLNALIKEQDAEKTRLREYVNIVQNFTMGNVRMAETRYGDALALYCDSAIGLNRMRNEYGLNRNAEEFELMNKSINMANGIVQNRFIIANSAILRDRHQEIIDGLKGITNRRTKMIETYIEATYNQDDTTSNSK